MIVPKISPRNIEVNVPAICNPPCLKKSVTTKKILGGYKLAGVSKGATEAASNPLLYPATTIALHIPPMTPGIP